MFGWFTGTVKFRLRLTNYTFRRWNRLIERLGYGYKEENEVLLKALALYRMLADWESMPLFILDADGDPDRYDMTGQVSAPVDCYAYDRRYQVSHRQWREMKMLLRETGEKDMDHLVDRSLKLLELVLQGRHPQLYTVDELGDFQKVRIVIE